MTNWIDLNPVNYLHPHFLLLRPQKKKKKKKKRKENENNQIKLKFGLLKSEVNEIISCLISSIDLR